MIERALGALPWVKLSDWEVNQKVWTRTRQVLQYHQVYLPIYLYFTPTHFGFMFYINNILIIESYQFGNNL